MRSQGLFCEFETYDDDEIINEIESILVWHSEQFSKKENELFNLLLEILHRLESRTQGVDLE